MIIDNNSVDNTKEVVTDCSRRSPIPIFYFHESQQGLSAARNRAVEQASGDYVGFLDDECVVRPDWLEIIIADIDQFAPVIIGGPYTGALLPGPAPKWFKPEYGNAYFLIKRFGRGFQKEFRASGGNMVLHRRVCETQQFDQRFGMKGDELKLGEEILLQERFMRENPGTMVFYEPRMEVAHFVLPQKMSLSYCARRTIEAAAVHYKVGLVALSYQVARLLAYFCVSPFRIIFRDRRVYPFWQNYVYEKVIPRAMPIIGAALERFRRRYR